MAISGFRRRRWVFLQGWSSGSGRNQGLFNYILTLQSKGFKKDEIRDAIRIINNYVFADPLPDDEMSKILRDESFKPEEVIEKENAERAASRGFQHNDFAEELISLYHIITYNDVLYIYENGYYQADERVIEQKMIEMFPSIKQKQRSEVLAYIRIRTHVSAGQIHFDPWVVNIESGRFDLRTKTLSPHTPEMIEFDRIPVAYDPEAYSEPLDRMLDKVFCKDDEVRSLFEEMIGYTLMRHVEYQKAFMFYGTGANGKSTLLDLIKTFIGNRNYVSIDLSALTGRFAKAELEHKLANIGDDINNNDIRNSGELKRSSPETAFKRNEKDRILFSWFHTRRRFSLVTTFRNRSSTRRKAFIVDGALFRLERNSLDLIRIMIRSFERRSRLRRRSRICLILRSRALNA